KIDDAGDEYTILGYTIKRGNNEYIHNFNTDKEIFSSCAGAAIYRKKIFDKIGYFDEEFFAYMEDVDIGFRAGIYGYKNMYCSSAIVYHIGSATTGSRYNGFKVRTAARNNIFLIYKNMPFLMLLLNLPFLILGFLIKTLFFILKGYGKDYIKGLSDGFKGIKSIEKVKFSPENILNYIKIEFRIIYNTFYYPVLKLKR
ncbi:MAG: glycosyltransferase family 2 protein, partial [Caloramator sp.]|nr:glycosyltransferase family 2 protein [Caloramator sp.]